MQPAPQDWTQPFLTQAREDLRAARTMDLTQAPSTFCMLMQMVFEKLAKAAYARSGQVVPHTHPVASRLLTTLRRFRARPNIPQATESVFNFVHLLELAHPSVAGKYVPPWPQLEYPWCDSNAGKVLAPATDLPLARRVRDSRDRIGFDLLKLACTIDERFDEIFPP